MPLQETRHAFRILGRSPGFTAIAALSLALGIGANSAIFSLADALLLKPLPVAQPSSIVTIGTNTADNPFSGMSYPDYRDFRDKSRSFDGMVAFQIGLFGVAPAAREVAQMRMGMTVSEGFFHVLGVEPILGRDFLPEETQVAGRNPVVILGYDLWKNQFGGEKSVIGRTIRINGIDFNVVGVTPEKFTSLDQFVHQALFVPVAMMQRLNASPDNPLEQRGNHSFQVKARLKSGVSRETAQAELATIWSGIEKAYPDTSRDRKVAVSTELEIRVRQSPPDAILLATLMVLVGLVLLIACANVANLLLARGRARSREMAIRIAIGAGRLRLLKQLLTESLVLALLGGTLGLAVAYGGIRFMRTLKIPTDLPIVISAQLDARVLLYSLGAALVSALFFGLAPALQTMKTELVPALKEADLGMSVRRRAIGRNALVVGQVALAMVLLIASGMLIDSFRKSLVMNPGFGTDHRLMMEFDTALLRYSHEQTHNFYRNLTDRARTLPGVRSVALTRAVPFSPNVQNTNVSPEGYQLPKGQTAVSVFSSVIDEHFFDTMGLELVRGRNFTANDKEGSRRVAIVNEQFAKTYWPNQDPIGKRIRVNDSKDSWTEVVGLAKTSRYLFIAEPPLSFLYMPFAQNETTNMAIMVETYGDPGAIAGPLRDVVRSLDANQPVFNTRTMATFYEQRATGTVAMIMEMVVGMGVLGLALAMVGLYGLISYSVSRRTREIGVRMAIGAGKGEVLKMVLRQGMTLALSGIAIGGLASIGVGRLIGVGLAGIGQPNPLTFVIVPIGLLIITMIACYVPARRATLIDPIRALRYE